MSAPPRLIKSLNPYLENSSSPLATGIVVALLMAFAPHRFQHILFAASDYVSQSGWKTEEQHIGWVAHDSHCYRELTGRQNVELAARLRGVDPHQAWSRGCARVGAESFGERAVSTLSRGQRQRISLARALVHEPSVLLLDEPWSGLDDASSQRLEQVILEEKERGAIVIVVNHAAGLAQRLGARTVRIEGGRIKSDGR